MSENKQLQTPPPPPPPKQDVKPVAPVKAATEGLTKASFSGFTCDSALGSERKNK